MKPSRKFPSTRLRRNRQSENLRDILAENALSSDDLIQPIFIKEGLKGKESIESLPGVSRLGLDVLNEEISDLESAGIKAIALFPVIDPSKKDDKGSESLNEDNLVSQAIQQIKEISEMVIISDVALDPYTSHGHDGLINADGYVDNDLTLPVITEQALVLAKAGADIIAPSDMRMEELNQSEMHLRPKVTLTP